AAGWSRAVSLCFSSVRARNITLASTRRYSVIVFTKRSTRLSPLRAHCLRPRRSISSRRRNLLKELSMAKHQYATSPPNITTMPPGVPYIIGNEAAERFSFYGMRSILIVFMTQYLVTRGGAPDHMGNAEARQYFAMFVSAVY